MYKIGLLARAFALLQGVTGEGDYLELGEAHFERAVANSPDVWGNALAHKLAWAAWTLYGLTGRRSYSEYGCRMADHLVTLQQPDGGFRYPEIWPSYADAPLEAKYNTSAQFSTWIAYTRAAAIS